MEKILIFGHKSPDTDSVVSAYVLANLEQKLGKNVETCRLGNLNKETKYVFDYLNLEAPTLIKEVEEKQPVILVDHNEFPQSVDGIQKASIMKVVDHHRIKEFETEEPLYYRAEPLGCTCSIIYKLYQENQVEITKEIAILMLSAIISDTLLFKSPTCTPEDKEIASKLQEIAGIDIEKYGLEMLKAGTDLSDSTAEDLIKLDAKEVMIGNFKAQIAQVNTASIPDVMKRQAELEVAIENMIQERELALFVLAITDIINSNSQVIALGEKADIVEKAYQVKLENHTALLEGIVSRKKQILPVLSSAAQ